jgi:hypothetical protein
MVSAIGTPYFTLTRDQHGILESVSSALIAPAATDGLRIAGCAVRDAG